MIVTTDKTAFKVVWTILVIISVAFGFYNIVEVKNDYFNFDVITNIERTTPDNGTFPAITICTYDRYRRDRYRNGTLVSGPVRIVNSSNFTRFIRFRYLTNMTVNMTNRLDFFKIPEPQPNLANVNYDCFRFNAANNKSIYLITSNSSLDYYFVQITNHYIERISDIEYFNYSLFDPFFIVFIADNYLNSFEKVKPLVLELDTRHEIKIGIASTETKLGEPYNPCKESSSEQPYHQMNCIEACIFREIKVKYNCTYNSLFVIDGLQQCPRNLGLKKLKDEFSLGCKRECPESCDFISFSFSSFNTLRSNTDFTQFHFSIPDFSSLNITQIPKMNGFAYICNIGGALGLFMGISFLNIVEIIEFIIDISSLAFVR